MFNRFVGTAAVILALAAPAVANAQGVPGGVERGVETSDPLAAAQPEFEALSGMDPWILDICSQLLHKYIAPPGTFACFTGPGIRCCRGRGLRYSYESCRGPQNKHTIRGLQLPKNRSPSNKSYHPRLLEKVI